MSNGNDGSGKRRVALWALAGVLALAFAASGIGKLAGSENVVEGFEGWGYPLWSMYVVGVAEILGAALILVPGRKALGASLRFWGTMVLSVVMVGATGTHLVHTEYPMVALTLALLGLLAYLAKTARARPHAGA